MLPSIYHHTTNTRNYPCNGFKHTDERFRNVPSYLQGWQVHQHCHTHTFMAQKGWSMLQTHYQVYNSSGLHWCMSRSCTTAWVGQGNIIPTAEHLIRFMPQIRDHNSMTDENLTHELNITVDALNRIALPLDAPSNDMVIEPQTHPTAHQAYSTLDDNEMMDDPMDGT